MEKGVRKTIDEIIEDICNNYCKYPNEYKAEEHDGVELHDSDICAHCPLNKL